MKVKSKEFRVYLCLMIRCWQKCNSIVTLIVFASSVSSKLKSFKYHFSYEVVELETGRTILIFSIFIIVSIIEVETSKEDFSQILFLEYNFFVFKNYSN